MSVQFTLLPLFVHVALTFLLLFWTGPLRGRYALRGPAITREPYEVELALLFYTLTALTLFTRQADLLFVVLSWVFVIVQFGHLIIAFSGRRSMQPALLFTVAAGLLALMWLIFAIRLLLRL